jgi:hypothetical protein
MSEKADASKPAGVIDVLETIAIEIPRVQGDVRRHLAEYASARRWRSRPAGEGAHVVFGRAMQPLALRTNGLNVNSLQKCGGSKEQWPTV